MTDDEIEKALSRITLDRTPVEGCHATLRFERDEHAGRLAMLIYNGPKQVMAASVSLDHRPKDETMLFDMARDALAGSFIMGLETAFKVDGRMIYPAPVRPTGRLAMWFANQRAKLYAPN